MDGPALQPLDFAPLFLSLRVAFVAMLLVAIAGTLLGRAMSEREFRGKSWIEGLLLLPLVLPPVVTGWALLVLLGRNGPLGNVLARAGIALVFTPWAAVLAASIVAFPLMYAGARAAFEGVEEHLEEAALSLGANRTRSFWTIALPLALPGLASGAMLSFARALGEFGATVMVAGNIPGLTTTAPLALYTAAEGGDERAAAFYALLLGGVNALLVVVVRAQSQRVLSRRRVSSSMGRK